MTKNFLDDIVGRNEDDSNFDEKKEIKLKPGRKKKLKKMARDNKETVTFYIDSEVVQNLKMLSVKLKKRYSAIVEDAIKYYIKRKGL